MEQYKLQSYFKGLCNSFYIAYLEVKRLEKEIEEIDPTGERENAKCVSKVLERIRDKTNLVHKYISFKYTEPELEAEKERLEEAIYQKVKKSNELEEELKNWGERLKSLQKEIYKVLSQISNNKQTIIVTSKEEVYALMYTYYRESVIRVLNTKEPYLISFPKDNKICYGFLEVYLSGNEEKIEEFCKKNI